MKLSLKEKVMLRDLTVEIDHLAERAKSSFRYSVLDDHFDRVKNLASELPDQNKLDLHREYGNMIFTRPEFVKADIALRQMKQNKRIADELQKIHQFIKKKFR